VSEHREEHLDLCAGLALGSLDPKDRERIERHLAEGCEVCAAALADFSSATVLLAASAPPARPSKELRARVLSAVRDTPRSQAGPHEAEDEDVEHVRAVEGPGKVIELRQKPRTGGFPWIPVLAAAAFAATSGLLWMQVRNLQGEVAERRLEIADLARRLVEEERLNRVLSAPGARVAVLEITPQGEHALRARVTYDPSSRTAVVVFDNMKAPSGHDYQLWALHGATPRSLGVIETDERGRAVMVLDEAGSPRTLAAFAVSLEPAGGSPNPAGPSGPVVMLGKLSG
jgi:anti-sigma-K factor RskA